MLHFLAAGALLYALAPGPAPAPEDESARIVVDRDALLEFIQYRSKAFDRAAAEDLFAGMTEERRQRLIEDYAEEEVLYREAKAMGLDEADYVVKQRLVQKIRFLTETAIGDPPLTDAEVEDYYKANRRNYFIEPTATFTHVFLSAEERGLDGAAEEAERVLAILRRNRAEFEDAVNYGDRFPFLTNYVERTFDYVASQLGEPATREIFDNDGALEAWRGPVASVYGAHLFYVSKLTPGRTPPLAEIRASVREDALREKKSALVDEAIAGTIEDYEIIIDLEEERDDSSASELASAQ